MHGPVTISPQNFADALRIIVINNIYLNIINRIDSDFL